MSIEGDANRRNHREDNHYYTQLGLLFRSMSAEQKKAPFGNTARVKGHAPKEIEVRHIGNCMKADPAYGEGVANALGIELSEVK